MLDSNDQYTVAAKILHIGFYLALLAFCAYTPYMVFGVIPFNSDRSTPAVYTQVSVSPAFVQDELERDVLAEEFRWCRYCHIMQPGGHEEPGPELYRIFGRKAATVPRFYYSDAFTKAGESGLIWTEETIDKFITDPQAYIPGNRMVHGPVVIADPERRRRVINLLKKWTVEGSTEGSTEGNK